MRDDPLSERNLKFRRAQRHVREVRRAIKAYGNRGPNETVRDPNLKGNPIVGFRVRRQPPSSISISAGDALQDFKSALDHAVHELSRLNGATSEELEDCEFLIADTPNGYSSWEKKRLGALPASARAFIKDLQPSEGSLDTRPDRKALQILHLLARIDRHRHVHVTLLRLREWMLTFAPRDPLSKDDGLTLWLSDPTKVQVNANFHSSVCIEEPSMVSPLPLTETLEHVEATVRRILLGLAEFRP